MTTTDINFMGTAKLLLTVFGKQPGQSTMEFAKEIEGVKSDERFIAEVRAYALATLVD